MLIYIYFPALGAGGRRFESFCPDNENQGVTKVTPFFVLLFDLETQCQTKSVELWLLS